LWVLTSRHECWPACNGIIDQSSSSSLVVREGLDIYSASGAGLIDVYCWQRTPSYREDKSTDYLHISSLIFIFSHSPHSVGRWSICHKPWHTYRRVH
jgi:hypothetical protein